MICFFPVAEIYYVRDCIVNCRNIYYTKCTTIIIFCLLSIFRYGNERYTNIGLKKPHWNDTDAIILRKKNQSFVSGSICQVATNWRKDGFFI